MNHDEIRSHLDEYVDGTLPEAARRAIETHLASCGECRGEVEGLRTLLAEARALPRGIIPPRDLWPEIAARIERDKVIEVDFRARSRRSPWWTRGMLAAAAVVLIALSSAITARLVQAPDAPVAVQPQPGAGTGDVITALAAFRPAEQEYIRTADDLEAILRTRQDDLAPETVAVLEENLRIIDRAIAESRAALEADPNNRRLTEMLSGVYQQKIHVLQSAVTLQSTI